MKWLVCQAVLALMWAAPVSAQMHAIVIGHNAPPEGQPGLAQLSYADDDAVRLFQILRAASDDAVLLTDMDRRTRERYPELARRALPATEKELDGALLRLRAQLRVEKAHGLRPTVILAFSGHGAVDADGVPFLALRDGKWTRDELHAALESLADAQVHLIVDACQAGAVVGVRGPFDREQDASVVELDREEVSALVERKSLARLPHVGALVATAAGQQAHEWSRIESGVFTHELVSALRGAADVNGDLQIEYSEVQAFVAAANRELSDPRARPTLLTQVPFDRPTTVLLDLRRLRDTRWLFGDGSTLGRFHIELDNGQRLLEARVGDQRLALALPAERKAFVHVAGREAAIDLGESAAVAIESLRFGARRAKARGALDDALRQNLFATAYGPVYYKGFVDSHGGVTVRFGQPANVPGVVEAPTEPKPRPRRRWVRGLGGASLALALGAGVSALLALDAKSDFNETNLQREARDAERRFQRRGYAAIASAAAAAATGGAALGLWLAPLRGDRQSERGGAAVGLTLRGSF